MHTNDPIDPLVQHRPPSQVDEFGNVKPNPHPAPKFDADHPGYETTDVNTNGVVVFLGGLVASVIVFFFLCFGIGKAINFGLDKQDAGERLKSPQPSTVSGEVEKSRAHLHLESSPALEQQESASIARSFPSPRLDADDGNQLTSDLHAREDLLLEHNSVDKDGTLRIPVERAMELVAQRGLGTPAGNTPAPTMAGERHYDVHAPLTDGFARTAYEIDQMESREQKMKISRESEK